MFKKMIIGILALGLLSGCSMINTNLGSKSCNVNFNDGRPSVSVEEFCALNQESYLCNLDMDLCALHNGLVILSKEGIVLDAFQAEEFKQATGRLIALIQDGITVGDLLDLSMAYTKGMNSSIGIQFLILGDLIFNIDLPSSTMLPKADAELAVSSLMDLQKQVLAFSNLIGK